MGQNKENMDKVREMMAQADKVRQGSEYIATLPLDYTSLTGKHYEGEMCVHKPDMGEFMRIGGLKSEYLRRAGVVSLQLVDNTIKESAQIMATLAIVISKAPEWLIKLEAIKEPDVLFYVYDEYMKWEDSFRKRDSKESSGNSTDTEGEKAVDTP
jgi:hypothetical protein